MIRCLIRLRSVMCCNGDDPRSQQAITSARDQVLVAANSLWQEPFRLIHLNETTGRVVRTRKLIGTLPNASETSAIGSIKTRLITPRMHDAGNRKSFIGVFVDSEKHHPNVPATRLQATSARQWASWPSASSSSSGSRRSDRCTEIPQFQNASGSSLIQA